MAYSKDLRQRAIDCVKSGKSQKETARIFNISDQSIRKWIKLEKETGSVECIQKSKGRNRKVNSAQLKAYVTENPDKTLHEIAEIFHVSHVSIWKNLKKLKYSFKKKLFLHRAR
jgi:transposase